MTKIRKFANFKYLSVPKIAKKDRKIEIHLLFDPNA
jgi:hypothetical protein